MKAAVESGEWKVERRRMNAARRHHFLRRTAALLLTLCACIFKTHGADTDAQVAELVKTYSGSLVFVEDKGGAGSGFVVSIAGKKFADVEKDFLAALNRAKLLKN